MIVGGYAMDLYCRNGTECAFIGKEYEDFPGGNRFISYRAAEVHVAGESKADCVRDAKARGWLFSDRDVSCKWCAGLGKARKSR